MKSIKHILLIAFIYFIMATSLSKPQLPLSSALKIIEKCQERANLLGVKVTVAICDDGGHLIGDKSFSD